MNQYRFNFLIKYWVKCEAGIVEPSSKSTMRMTDLLEFIRPHFRSALEYSFERKLPSESYQKFGLILIKKHQF